MGEKKSYHSGGNYCGYLSHNFLFLSLKVFVLFPFKKTKQLSSEEEHTRDYLKKDCPPRRRKVLSTQQR